MSLISLCKKYKKTTTALITIVLIILFCIILSLTTFIPKTPSTDYNSEKASNNSFISLKSMTGTINLSDGKKPINTMLALKSCFLPTNDYLSSIFQIDIKLTSDNQIIVFGDTYIDDYCDCATTKFNEKKVKPENKTLAQLLQYNFAYNYQSDGEFPYRNYTNNDCRILTLREVFEYIRSQSTEMNKTFYFATELKDTGTSGKKCVDELVKLLREYKITNNYYLGTDNQSIADYIDAKGGLNRRATDSETALFYFQTMFGVKLTAIKYSVLQIHNNRTFVNFDKKAIVDYAHNYGLAMIFDGVTKVNDINRLQKIGADAIIGSDPRLIYTTLNKY